MSVAECIVIYCDCQTLSPLRFTKQKFGNPANANNRIPVRPQQAPSAFDFPVFQAGKRICLGQRMVSAGLGTSSLYRVVLQTQRACAPNEYPSSPQFTHTGNFRGQGPCGDAAAAFLVFHRPYRGGADYLFTNTHDEHM